MRYVVRRVRPWSAAKIGALFGFLGGLVAGALSAAAASAMMPYLAYIEQPVQPIGGAGILLIALLLAGVTSVVFTVTALLYNLVSWLGASLVVDLDREEQSANDTPSHQKDVDRGPLLKQTTFETE